MVAPLEMVGAGFLASHHAQAVAACVFSRLFKNENWHHRTRSEMITMTSLTQMQIKVW